jgi:YebC/PmpR family DNA-binding regulatory protein
MSGHSKWATTRRAKEAKDAKRGNIFTKHAKCIALAAKHGGDPEMNPSLKTAIENAKKDNMPNSNIEKAIKKGTGELKEGNEIVELTYEGYGPEGIAVMVLCHTDNKQRTVSNLRHIFSKNGGSLGENGCVSYMFHKKGSIIFENCSSPESIELTAIESGCEDVFLRENILEVTTKQEDFHQVLNLLKSNGFTPSSSELSLVPDNYIKVSDEKIIDRITKFIDTLEEDDDVSKVFSNFDIE